MKGIILAGGSGTRLHPLTHSLSKQLLPVYDKPMIYYPLSTLMLAGIKDILIISTPQDTPRFEELLEDGSQLGMSFTYAVQENPNGLAEAFIIGKDFVGDDDVALVLGDNLFYGHDFAKMVKNAVAQNEGATVFGYYVNDPKAYGVVDFEDNGNALSLEEKPVNPKSNYAVVGLYFYDNDVIDIACNMEPSTRGELEITDVNKEYLKCKKLKVELMGRGFAWLDTGTHGSLLEASQYVEVLEARQGLKIACIEEIAYSEGFIDKAQFTQLADDLKKSTYGEYLLNILKREA